MFYEHLPKNVSWCFYCNFYRVMCYTCQLIIKIRFQLIKHAINNRITLDARVRHWKHPRYRLLTLHVMGFWNEIINDDNIQGRHIQSSLVVSEMSNSFNERVFRSSWKTCSLSQRHGMKKHPIVWLLVAGNVFTWNSCRKLFDFSVAGRKTCFHALSQSKKGFKVSM